VEGHAGHHHRLAGRLAALRERDVEQARGLLGVTEEQLVEIAHAVENQRVRIPGLDGEVLLHHGCVPGWRFAVSFRLPVFAHQRRSSNKIFCQFLAGCLGAS
jgi:hypothetical protein